MSEKTNSREVTDTPIEEKLIVDVDGVGSFETTKTTNAENDVKISIPKEVMELGPEAIDKFKRHAEDLVSAGGKTLKDRMEWKKEQEDRDREREAQLKELKDLQAEVEKLKNPHKPAAKPVKVPTIKELVAKQLGVDKIDSEQLRDFMDEDPEGYASALETRQDLVIEAKYKQRESDTLHTIKTQSLRQKIADDGYDVKMVEQFKEQNGFSDLKHAYNFFKNNAKPRTSPIDIVNTAEDKKKSHLTFIEPGNVKQNQKSAVDIINGMDADAVRKLKYDDPLLVRARAELNF